MKRILFLLLLVIFCYNLNSQVKLETKYGTVKGYIVKETDSSYTIKEFSGKKYRVLFIDIRYSEELYSHIKLNTDSIFVAHIYKSDSNFIFYKDESGKDTNMKLTDIMEFGQVDYNKVSYSSLGFTFGLPGGLNVFYSFQQKDIANIRLEAGFIGKEFGFEADLGLNLYRNNIFETNISLGTGIYFEAYGDVSSYPFLALKYNLSIYGIFGELGYCFFQNSSDVIYYQIGYVFRLLD